MKLQKYELEGTQLIVNGMFHGSQQNSKRGRSIEILCEHTFIYRESTTSTCLTVQQGSGGRGGINTTVCLRNIPVLSCFAIIVFSYYTYALLELFKMCHL